MLLRKFENPKHFDVAMPIFIETQMEVVLFIIKPVRCVVYCVNDTNFRRVKMSNFCTQCGSPLKPDMKFCTKCGAAVEKESYKVNLVKKTDKPKNTVSELVDETVVEKTLPKPKTLPKKKKSNNTSYGAIIAIAVCLVVIIGCCGGYYLYSESQKSTVVTNNQSTQKEVSTQKNQPKSEADKIKGQNAIAQKKIDDTIKKAGAELSRYGYSVDFSYTTYGHSDAGFLTLYQGGEMVVIDRKNNRAGVVLVREGFEKFRIAIDKKQPGSVIIDCEFKNEKPGHDQEAGYWNGTTHYMSVFANYSFERNGELKPGMLTTGRGRNPSHLQDVLYETRNVDFINLFLTESLYVDLM